MPAGQRNAFLPATLPKGVLLPACAALALLLAAPAHAQTVHASLALSADTLSATGTDDASHVMLSLDNPSVPVTVQLASFRPTAPEDATPYADIAGGPVLQSGLASWYGRAWKGRRTSSGARFNPEDMTAASHTLPLGTRVLVTLEGTARSVLVTITDHQGAASRVIDLSLAAARKIGMVGMGTARVVLRKV